MNPSSTGVTLFSDRTYTIIRLLATVWLPALGAAYFSLAQIWGLPKAEEVVGTIAILNVLAGVVTGAAQKVYNATGSRYDGTATIKIDPDESTTKLILNVPEDLTGLEAKQELVFKMIPR